MSHYDLHTGVRVLSDAPLPGTPTVNLKVKRLHAAAKLPTLATEGAACWDLYADGDSFLRQDRLVVTVPTGIAVEVPPGYVGLVCSRSGMAARQRMFVVNAPGIIDSDYRGELQVILGMLPTELAWPSLTPITIPNGSRIAQFMLMPIPQLTLTEVAELSPTIRGEAGLGSTGT